MKTFESYTNDKKVFEGYVDDKILALKELKKIIDFMEKYKMQHFEVGNEYKGLYHFEYIEKTNDGYIIEYIDYTQDKQGYYHGKDIKQIRSYINCGLLELPNKVIDALMETISDRWNIEYHLEMITGDVDEFLNIIKIYKEPIEFNTWMMSLFIENDQQDNVNNFEFQNILFSTHPEAFDSFMDECVDGKHRAKSHNFEPLKLDPKIKTKYNNLFDKWNMKHQSKKFNL